METILTSPHLWVMFVLATSVNAVFFRIAATQHSKEHPELADGFATLIRGWLFWGNLPWIVMGIGLEFGGVSNLWHYFQPREGNPYVLAWFVCVMFLWILGFWWIFLRGGAEMLAKHSMIFNYSDLSNPAKVKLFYLICVGGGVVGFILMFFMEFPLPFGDK